MEIRISERLKKELPDVKPYGYETIREFIEDAIRRRILELRKAEFFSLVSKIRSSFERKGIKEEDILEDFEKFSHKK